MYAIRSYYVNSAPAIRPSRATPNIRRTLATLLLLRACGHRRCGESLFHVGCKLLRLHVTDNLVAVPLLAVCAEKNNRRRAEHAEAFEQRLVVRVVRGHIGLQPDRVRERAADPLVRKRVGLV